LFENREGKEREGEKRTERGWRLILLGGGGQPLERGKRRNGKKGKRGLNYHFPKCRTCLIKKVDDARNERKRKRE